MKGHSLLFQGERTKRGLKHGTLTLSVRQELEKKEETAVAAGNILEKQRRREQYFLSWRRGEGFLGRKT